KRKSLSRTETHDEEILVKFPVNVNRKKIETNVRKKAPWIIKQQSFFLSFQPKTPVRKFVSGETHLYLGRQYRLKIINSEFDSVKLKGRFIEVNTNNKNKAKALMKEWYLKNARRKFKECATP